jgi:GH15 family glucan-1,4-alpha-glucosidase
VAYKPIENYGVIGDLATIALVADDGSIDYMCLPQFDSPSIFAALLDDKKGGRFAIAPVIKGARRKQLYLPDTNILLTRFLSDDGVGEITDFMVIDDDDRTQAIVRRVKGIRGPFSFHLHCSPRFDYARARHTVEQRDNEILFVADDEDCTKLRLRTPVPLTVEGGDAVGEFTLDSGETLDFVLEIALPGDDSSAAPGWVDTAFNNTLQYWRRWVAHSNYHGRWREMVSRSALTLKLLTSAQYGSIAAAGTFGLPEQVGGERNWDYRYTWIRDGAFSIATLIRLGFTEEARAFVKWIGDRYDQTDEPGILQIMYGIDGRKDLPEEILDDLEGYRRSAPVRVGNAAFGQLQLDIYGELMHMLDLYDERVESLSYDLWRHVADSLNWVSKNWNRADEGIWEIRGGQQEFLYSRLMSWVALDRGIRIATRRSLPAPVDKWLKTRDEIHSDIYHEFWDEARTGFVQYKGSKTLDSSALLLPLIGFISSRDQRWLATMDAIERDLVSDALVVRYLTEKAATDGLTGTEGTFCMCSYWYIECVARAGELEKARLLFEKMHGYANHLGLYAEEMDPSGCYLGNFPQAFTHWGLIHCALFLHDALAEVER